MLIRLAQIALFLIGLFLPFWLLPDPLPPNLDKGQLGMGATALGVAFAYVGTVGISNLLASIRRRCARQRGTDPGPERIAWRSQPLIED